MALLRRRTRIDAGAEDAARRELLVAGAEVSLLRAAVDVVPIGLVIVDAAGDVVRRTTMAPMGTHAAVLLDEAVEHIAGEARAGSASERRLELFGPPTKVFQLRGFPLAGGGAVVAIDDISERVQLDAVRTDFVANISHELKTPVGGLAVLAEAIAAHDDPDVMRHLAATMVEEAHRASMTIDDLLELSRIELGGQAVLEPVDTAVVVAEAVQRVVRRAESRAIRLVVDDSAPPHVLGDSRQLVSAVTNLLDNAVNYSHDGGAVHISAQRRGAWVEIRVVDSGIGIPARDLARVFERFYRVDRARSRETGGTGLGLAIVRHVATNHGGEVRVASREGEGSTFTLRVRPVQG